MDHINGAVSKFLINDEEKFAIFFVRKLKKWPSFLPITYVKSKCG